MLKASSTSLRPRPWRARSAQSSCAMSVTKAAGIEPAEGSGRPFDQRGAGSRFHTADVSQRAELISLGFDIADGEQIELTYAGSELTLRFVDWRDAPVVAVFRDTVAFKWQRAEHVAGDERFDSGHIIHDSEWLAEHVRQREATEEHQHLK